MGDPFGLVADESDYLIHPAKIANGQGVRFYGDYRFTYTGVTNWDYHLDAFTPPESSLASSIMTPQGRSTDTMPWWAPPSPWGRGGWGSSSPMTG